MNQSVKRLLILLLVLVTAAAVVFLSVFLLAKQKKIFLNKWFVNESRSIIGADISAYQADIDLNVLNKEKSLEDLIVN